MFGSVLFEIKPPIHLREIEKIEAAERARALASKLRAEQRAEAAKRVADSADFSGG